MNSKLEKHQTSWGNLDFPNQNMGYYEMLLFCTRILCQIDKIKQSFGAPNIQNPFKELFFWLWIKSRENLFSDYMSSFLYFFPVIMLLSVSFSHYISYSHQIPFHPLVGMFSFLCGKQRYNFRDTENEHSAVLKDDISMNIYWIWTIYSVIWDDVAEQMSFISLKSKIEI